MSFFKLRILLNFFMSFCRTRRLAFIGFALINLLFQCAIVHSQDIYPNKPIRLIVGFPPGGGNDLLSRLVAAKLSEVKGWAFSIENVAGSGGLLGANNIAKSTPNGYTIGIGSIGTLSINPSLYSKIPYNIAKDLSLIHI